MFCYKCGTQLDDGAEFCHMCGTKVVYENTIPQMSDLSQDMDSVQNEYTSSGESDFTHEQEYKETVQESMSTDYERESFHEKKTSEFDEWWDNCSKGKKIFIVLGGILACGVALVLLIAFLQKFGAILFGILVIAAIICKLVTGTEGEKKEIKKDLIKFSIWMVIIISISIVVAARPDFIANIFQPGASVRNSYLTQYSEKVTIEEAFDNYFDNGKWSNYKDNEYSYVVFTGSCKYLGERVDVKVTFKITGDNFIIESLDLNGREQNDFILYGLLSAVYEDETYEYDEVYNETYDNADVIEKNSVDGFIWIEEPTGKTDEMWTKITGVIQNTSNFTYDYAIISFNLYDSFGNQIGTAVASVSDLKSGGTWKFEAIGEGNAPRFEFTSFDYY